MLSIITANVNGIRAAARRGGLQWLADADADIYLLQEVRATDEQLAKTLADAGLSHLHVAHTEASDLGRAGVAILSKHPIDSTRIGIGPDEFAASGRWIEARIHTASGPLTAISTYIFTGEDGTDRQPQKYRFLDAMRSRLAELKATSEHAIIGGDFNIAHHEADLKNWKGNLKKSGFLIPEREYLDALKGDGWTDLGRAHAGDVDGPYTWWSWRGKAFDNDTGWRIDYLWATPDLAATMSTVEVGRAATYSERWSDHAPVTASFVL